MINAMGTQACTFKQLWDSVKSMGAELLRECKLSPHVRC